MKLDRLKELAEIPIEDAEIEDAYRALVALPGLLRVCDAHMAALIAIQQWNGVTYERAYELSEKKLEELLG